MQFHNWPSDQPQIIPAGSSIFTDGSGFDTAFSNILVAAWAVVVADENGECISSISGVVPLAEAPEQIARDGEDDAVDVE